MRVIWHLRDADIECNMTENSFERAMTALETEEDDAYIQINDSRFDDSVAKFVKRSEILGFACPETAILRYEGGRI